MRPYQHLRIARLRSKTVSIETPYKTFKENPKYPRLSKWIWDAAVKLGILKPYIDNECIRVEDITEKMQIKIVDAALQHIENAIDNGAKRDRLCLIIGMGEFDEILDSDLMRDVNAFQFMGQFGYRDEPSPDPYSPYYEYQKGKLYGIPVCVYPWIKGMAVIER